MLIDHSYCEIDQRCGLLMHCKWRIEEMFVYAVVQKCAILMLDMHGIYSLGVTLSFSKVTKCLGVLLYSRAKKNI